MKLILLLMLTQLKKSKSRLLLALFTMVVATSLMLCMMGEYEQMLKSFSDYEEIYMGKYDLYLVGQASQTAGMRSARSDTQRQHFNPAILNKIATLPHVRDMQIMTENRVAISPASKGSDYVPMRYQVGPSRHPVMLSINTSVSPYPLVKGHFLENDENSCVMGSAVAEREGLHVGDSIYVHTLIGAHPLVIVGIIEQPLSAPIVGANLSKGQYAPPAASFYVLPQTAERLMGQKLTPKYANIVLGNREMKTDFLNAVEGIKKEFNSTLYVCDGQTILDVMHSGRGANRLKSDAYTIMGMVFLCTVFIVFTALSIGVSERINQFAILRTVGVTRGQIATLVLTESILIAIVAWVIGCLIGSLYTSFAIMSGSLWATSLGLILLGALLSSFIPIYQACKTSPIEGLKSVKIPLIRQRCLSPILLIIALLLIFAQVGIVHVPYLHHTTRQLLYLYVGYPLMLIGFLLLIPAIVFLVETCLLPLFAYCLRFNFHYLKNCFTANILRTVGICAVLTVGLCLYTMTQFWGHSMLVPFLPNEATPTAIAVFSPIGVPDASLERIKQTTGVDSDRFLCLALEQLPFSLAQSKRFEQTGLSQNNVVVIGVDLDKAFKAIDPMFKLRFVEGNLLDAVKKMENERACLIPDGFATIAQLKLNDTIEVVSPLNANQTLTYTIAGIVEIPGWHWLTKHSGLRNKGGFTAGICLTNDKMARADFKPNSNAFFWFDITTNADVKQMELDLQKIATEQKDQILVQNNKKIKVERPYVKITTVEGIHNTVQRIGENSIQTMSKIPLIVLFITGLTLLSTLFASARARLWEFGLFRTLGMTKSVLWRILLTESLIIATIATVLSLLYGVIIAHCAIDICAYAYHFGGITPPLIIPWKGLLIGFGSVYLIALIATLAPLLLIRKKGPVELLQRGRIVTD